MESGDKPMMVSYRDLHLLGEVPVQYLKSRGYEGLVAFPDPNQIDPVSGKDLRVGDDTPLCILVWVSRLKRVKLENRGLSDTQFADLQAQVESRMPDDAVEPQPLMQEELGAFGNELTGIHPEHPRFYWFPVKNPGRWKPWFK